jgi:hypothetical protein
MEQDIQMTSFNGGVARGLMVQIGQHDCTPNIIQADRDQVKQMVKTMSEWLQETT